MVDSIFTDGGARPNDGTGKGAWAFVAVEKGSIMYELSGSAPVATNNQMELFAVIKALQYLIAAGKDGVTIFSDSQYVVNTINLGWKRKKNKELWDQFDTLKASRPGIRFEWVRGHDGNKFNEAADSLVSKALEGA